MAYQPSDEDKQRFRWSGLVTNLGSDQIDAIEAELVWRELDRGEHLIRQGEPAHEVWVVLRGRFEVLQDIEQGTSEIIGWVEAGETVGELALLTDRPRSATVRAMRSSLVAGLSKDRFEELTKIDPSASVALLRLLATRLLRRPASAAPRPKRSVLAVIAGTAGAPVASLTRGLLAQFGGSGRFVSLGPRDRARFSDEASLCEWLDRVEREHDWIVLEGAHEHREWNERILGVADRVVFVVGGQDAPYLRPPVAAWMKDDSFHRRELVIVHHDEVAEPSGTSAWLDLAPVHLHHHVRLGNRRDLARLARLLTGRAIALVLAGGAARGAAHVGVLRALEERDIPIDLVCGTSAGAVVAGFVGMGRPSPEVQATFRREIFRRWLFDFRVPAVSLFAGDRLRAALDRIFGEARIEDLWRPMFCASSSLTRAEVVIIRRGVLAESVLTSGAIPGLVPPIRRGNELLVDGMMLANLPVEEVDQIVPCRKIAVNLIPAVDRTFFGHDDPPKTGLRALVGRLTPNRSGTPLIAELGLRSFLLSEVRQSKRLAEQVDCFIEPAVGGISFLDLAAYDRLVELGYEAGRQALDQWRARAELHEAP